MKLALAAALLTGLAFLGSRISVVHLLLRRLTRISGLRHLLLTGTEFLLIGLLLGPHAGIGVFDPATLAGLAPILGLALAWIGLLFGIQWDLRRLPPSTRFLLPAALGQSSFTLLVVALATGLALGLWLHLPLDISLAVALTLGAAAADTAQSPVTLGPLLKAGTGRVLRTIADVDGLVPILGFGLVCCLALFHAGDERWWLWLAGSVGLGLSLGFLVTLLGSFRLGEDDLLVVLLGAILLGGGAALRLSLSPLLVNAIAGALVANIARPRTCQAVRRLLLQGDRAVYILLLLLAGALWNPAGSLPLALVVIYLLARILGKCLGSFLFLRRLVPSVLARRLGFGLLSNGGLAVAIVVNLQLLVPSHADLFAAAAQVATGVVLVSVVLSELITPVLAQRLLPFGTPGDPCAPGGPGARRR